MAKVSAIIDDNVVIIDGDIRKVDLHEYAAEGIHAVQWDGAKGHVEFKGDKRNEKLNELGRFVGLVDAHGREMPEADKHRKAFLEMRIAEEHEFAAREEGQMPNGAIGKAEQTAKRNNRITTLMQELDDLDARNSKTGRPSR